MKCQKYAEERDKALRIIREKLIKEMSEKAKQIREKAKRKTKDIQIISDRRSKSKDYSFQSKRNLKHSKSSNIIRQTDNEE